MRVFFLTTEFPFPASAGGRVRTLAQLRLLLSQPEVSQLTLFSLTEQPVGAAELRALEAELRAPLPPQRRVELRLLPPLSHPVHLRQRPGALLDVAATRLFTGVPYLAAKWQSTAVRRSLSAALAGSPSDVVYIDHLGMAGYLAEVRRRLPRARVIIEEHNVESDFFRQFAEELPLPLRALARLEYQAAARFEASALAQADAVVAISATDAADLRALIERHPTGPAPSIPPILAVPPVVTSTEPLRLAQASDAPRLCYVGSLTWRPNAQGLDWFCEKVWPRVRKARPDAELIVAGSGLPVDASGRLRVPGAWQVPGVQVAGYVADLETLYSRSLGMVAPICGGSGVRIKLLEAFRAGMPVVTTPAGAAGLLVRHEVELLIASESDPAQFAGAVTALLADDQLRERLRLGGYRYLTAHHGPEQAARALRTALGLDVR